MKSYIFNALPCAVACSLLLASCSREEENLWDDSAAIRLEKVVKEQSDILIGAPNGWSMYYYAPEADGAPVNFTLSFKPDYSVTIGSRNSYNASTYTEDTSMWEILTDNGPVLSFNSYNSVFHFFSDPDANGIVGSGTQGVGFGGDYEFMVLSYCQDSVVLKGKKTGVYCKMFPLQADAVGEQYFDKLDSFESLMFNSLLPYVWFEAANGERYTTHFNPAANTAEFCIEGGDPLFDTQSLKYIVTDTGIHFPVAFTGENDDISVSDFDYDQTSTTLIERQGNSRFCGEQIDSLFHNTSMRWAFYEEDTHGQFNTIYKDVIAGCRSVFKQTFNHFSFRYNISQKKYALWFRNGSRYNNCNLYCKQNAANGEVSFTFDGTGDSNGLGHLSRVSAFKDMVNLLQSTAFTIESESNLNGSKIKLTSKANPDDYIYVNAE